MPSMAIARRRRPEIMPATFISPPTQMPSLIPSTSREALSGGHRKEHPRLDYPPDPRSTRQRSGMGCVSTQSCVVEHRQRGLVGTGGGTMRAVYGIPHSGMCGRQSAFWCSAVSIRGTISQKRPIWAPRYSASAEPWRSLLEGSSTDGKPCSFLADACPTTSRCANPRPL